MKELAAKMAPDPFKKEAEELLQFKYDTELDDLDIGEFWEDLGPPPLPEGVTATVTAEGSAAPAEGAGAGNPTQQVESILASPRKEQQDSSSYNPAEHPTLPGG